MESRKSTFISRALEDVPMQQIENGEALLAVDGVELVVIIVLFIIIIFIPAEDKIEFQRRIFVQCIVESIHKARSDTFGASVISSLCILTLILRDLDFFTVDQFPK